MLLSGSVLRRRALTSEAEHSVTSQTTVGRLGNDCKHTDRLSGREFCCEVGRGPCQTPCDVFANNKQQEFGNSEDSLSDFKTFLFHSRQSGAGHVFGSASSGETSLLQDKVIVGCGVHGVKNIGVVGNLQLCVETE